MAQHLSELPALQLYLLGPPEVRWAGHPLPIPRRQARGLLYRLAARPQPVPREQLCFLFWPDIPEYAAHRHLSHLLTHLRRALPIPDLLLVTEEHIALDTSQVWSDVPAFKELCASDLFEQAIALYRGPFLAGFSLPESAEFEAWTGQERRACEELYLKALTALIEELTAQGEYNAAITYARRYLETDDLAEDVHRRLIELYAATGDRAAALRQFERCVAVLERELGVSPLPETRAAYQTVLEGRPAQPLRSPIKPSWATLPGLRVPLVGRDQTLRRLHEAYLQAAAGHGQVVLISGEAGIGKSRLMQEFATSLAGQALILSGACYRGAQAVPYQPIAQALRSLLAQGDKETRGQGDLPLSPAPPSSLSPTWLAEVARLLPELRSWFPNLPPAIRGEPDEARARLFEALCRVVLGLAPSPSPQFPPLPLSHQERGRGGRLLLLCLDDLHWADRTTLDWLAYLGHHLRGQRVLILGAYRSEEADALAELRRTLARLGLLSELRLSGLDPPDVLAILRHLTHSPLHPLLPLLPGEEEGGLGDAGEVALADRLQKATGGNPFFLLETLRAHVESGQPLTQLADLEDLPLPDTVRQAIEARLRRLSPRARQILEAGAILGLTFSLDEVRLTAGRRELETLDGLDELVARQLLTEEPPAYRFQHELAQRAVETNLSPMRRQLLHRRAGRALEHLAPDQVAAMARHFDAGGEIKKALHYHGLAARRAEGLFAWREAEEHQSRMLALLDQLDPEHGQPDYLARRGQVLVARADQRYFEGRLAERDADLAALTTLAEASGDEGLRLQALIRRVRYLNLDARYEQAIASAEEGLAVAERVNDLSARCHLLNQIGFARYFLGQPLHALAVLEAALALAPQADREIRRHITHTLGYVHFHLGNYARSLACHEAAYADHQAVGDYNGMAWASFDIAASHLEMGHFTEALQHLDEGLALARRIGARPAEAYGLILLGCWNLYRSNYIAALDHFRQAQLTQEELRTEHGRVAVELGMGLTFYHLGDLAEARRCLDSAVARARTIAHRRRLTEALVALGLVAVAAGQMPVARNSLDEAVALARQSDHREGLASGLAALARAERASGDPAGALAHAAEAARVARESTLPVGEMWGEMEAALALLVQDEPEAAQEHTERALALLPQAHEGWIGAEEVHRAHALVLQALGRAESAAEQTRLAEAIIRAKAERIPDPSQRERYHQFIDLLIR